VKREPALGAFALGVVSAVGLAGVVALAALGCATPPPPIDRTERPVDYTPDGGWLSYRPGPNYEPKPMEGATGVNPQMNPVVPASPSLNPSVGH
jgi:hypothetical protein